MTTTITSLPTIPQRSASATFPARVDALLQAFEAEFQPDLNTWISEVNTYKTTIESHLSNTTSAASTSASTQASTKTNAQSAATAAGISVWVSGTTYAIDVLVYSPLNLRLYRRLTAGAGTTDPSLDFTNWRMSARELNLNLPSIQPSLRLNFFSGVLDSRVTFNRASSGTFVNKKGLIELASVNTPRFDYDPLTMICKGLLIEESRTNLLTYSEQFDNVAWAFANTSITANAATAPDGASTADLLIENSSTGQHNRYPVTAPVSSTGIYTLTVFAKQGPGSRLLRLATYHASNGAADAVSFFNLVTGAVYNLSQANGAATPIGNGWWRCSITTGSIVSGTNIYIGLSDVNGGLSYTGDGSSGIYIWGAQLEAGSFATSYIPTAGSSVTRAADIASMTGTNFSSWYRQDEGTFVVKGKCEPSSTGKILIDIGGGGVFGTTAYIERTASGYAAAPGTAPVNLGINGTVNTVDYQISLSLKNNDAAMSTMGGAIGTDTSCTVPSANQLRFGRAGWADSSFLNGHLSYVVFYPKRLTNAEDVALSTY